MAPRVDLITHCRGSTVIVHSHSPFVFLDELHILHLLLHLMQAFKQSSKRFLIDLCEVHCLGVLHHAVFPVGRKRGERRGERRGEEGRGGEGRGGEGRGGRGGEGRGGEGRGGEGRGGEGRGGKGEGEEGREGKGSRRIQYHWVWSSTIQ